MKKISAAILGLLLIVSVAHAQTTLPISKWPIPATGSINLSAGDQLVATRSGVTYGLTVGIGGNCASNAFVNSISPQGVPSCTSFTPSTSIPIGTSATNTNPSRTGQSSTGLFSSAVSQVGVSAGGVIVEQWNTISSGVNYISDTPGATGTAPIIQSAGTDTNIGLSLNATGVAEVSTNGNVAYGISNNAALLPKTRKCMANVMTGAGRCRFLIVSDSVAQGWGTQGGGSDIKTYAWPSQLAKILQRDYNIPADYDSFNGNGGASNPNSTYDPRITAYSGSWTSSSSWTAGGPYFENTGSTGTFSFKPVRPVDTFKVWYPTNTSGQGVLAYNLDGGSSSTQSQVAALSLTSLTKTATSPGIHQINFSWSSGSPVYIAGVEAWDSTHPGISINDAGWFGSASTDWNNTSEGTIIAPPHFITTYAADLVLLDLDVNDAVNATSLTTYNTNIAALITAAQAGGSDVLIVTSNHGQGTSGDTVVLPYVQAIVGTARTNGFPVVDNWSRMVSSAYQTTQGWFFDGSTGHITAQGSADFAVGISAVLETIIPPTATTPGAFQQSSGASDVNYLQYQSAATGLTPSIVARGSDTNITLQLSGQGTRGVAIGTSLATSPLAVLGLGTSAPIGTQSAATVCVDTQGNFYRKATCP